MASVPFTFFDIVWADVPEPSAKDPTPSVTLPIGGSWQPNDWRIVIFGGNLAAAGTSGSTTYFTYPGGTPTPNPMPPPAGWSAIGWIYGTSPLASPQIVAHKLEEGDTDAEYSMLIPLAAGPYGGGTANKAAWKQGGGVKPSLLAFTIRGVDPAWSPVTCWLGASAYGGAPAAPTIGSGDADPTTPTPWRTYTYASRTGLGPSVLPACEVLVFADATNSFPTPTGWTDLWDNGFSGDNSVRQSSYAATQALFGRTYTSGTSTGTLTMTFVDVASVPATEGVDHGLTGHANGGGGWFIYFMQAKDVSVSVGVATALTTTANAVTPSVSTAVTVSAGTAVALTTAAYPIYSALTGYTIFDPTILPGTPVIGSVIRWQSTAPAGGSVVVETSLDNGATWQRATSGQAVPGLREGDTTTTSVLTRVTLTRASVSDAKPTCSQPELRITTDDGWPELLPAITALVKDTDVELSSDSGGGASGGGGGQGVEGSGGGQIGGGLAITLKGVDFSRAISKAVWQQPYFIAANTSYEDALQAMVKDRFPSQTRFQIATTHRLCPTLIYGTTPNTDAWQDIRELGIAIGYVCYFAPDGTFVAKPVADPSIAPPMFDIGGGDSAIPVISWAKKKLTDEGLFNWIVIDGEAVSPLTGREIVAVHAEATNDDSIAKYGPKPLQVTLQAVTTQEQAQIAADALLLLQQGAPETLEVVVPPNAAIEPYDVGAVTLPDVKASGNYMVQGIELPLSPRDGMRLTFFRQSVDDDS